MYEPLLSQAVTKVAPLLTLVSGIVHHLQAQYVAFST